MRHTRFQSRLLPKDYIATGDGLYFAVVLPGPNGDSVCSQPRYVISRHGAPLKLNTKEAYRLLRKDYPHFLIYSEYLDAETCMLPVNEIKQIYRPRETIERIEQTYGEDDLKKTAFSAINILEGYGIRRDAMGITGSLMLDFHDARSDIDIVIYDRTAFHAVRNIIQEAMLEGEFHPLDETMWREAYERRACALGFEEYKRHETRKYNKFVMGGFKIDVSYVPEHSGNKSEIPIKKLGPSTIRAVVIDDSYIFDYPARYLIENDDISEIHVYTATYFGQAFKDEVIEASGMVERDSEGNKYMVIGTSREAQGEYLRVIKNSSP